MIKAIAIAITLAMLASAAGAAENASYTLYRGSVASGVQRVHIATFDATEGEAYNRENCATAASLFKQQPGVTVRYWCEPGPLKSR